MNAKLRAGPGRSVGGQGPKKHPRPTQQPQVGTESVAVFGAVGRWESGEEARTARMDGGLCGKRRKGWRSSTQVDIFSFLLFYASSRGTRAPGFAPMRAEDFLVVLML